MDANGDTKAANRRANFGCLLPLIMFLVLAFAFILGAIYENRQVKQAEMQYHESHQNAKP
jgi:cell division protein FtsI/penicillin-binding protein 2